MTDIDKEKYRELIANLLKGHELQKRRNSASNEEYFAKMKEFGIDLSEEKIIADYDRIRDARKLDDSYYEEFGHILDDEQKEEWLNSDATILLIDRIVPLHFNIEDTGDPFFIDGVIGSLYEDDLKKADQKDIEKVFRALITFSHTRDHHTLADVMGMYDIRSNLKEMIRVCHDRNPSFRALIKELYACYEDADPHLFPSVYKEYLKEKK
ncbi:MAG: hypothetical protein K6G61_00295 [Solobacterium sp.]|nr:hypothetical protein [Solobacterium sp.]